MNDKNSIYAIIIIGVLLFLILLVGGLYNITGATTIPAHAPGTCINVTDDLFINNDTVLCPGTFYVNDTGANGVIIINASNLVLTCNNTIIIGNTTVLTSIGIQGSGQSNITIRGCTITNYYTGITFPPSDNNNITIVSNTIYTVTNGISFGDVNNSRIENNIIYNSSSEAITLPSGCFADNITGNIIYNSSDHGISIADGLLHLIENNTIYNTSLGSTLKWAINIEAPNNTIKNNNITDDGIRVYQANYNTIISNNFTNTENAAIRLVYSNYTNVTGNIINNVGGTGIRIVDSVNNTLYNNYVSVPGGTNAIDNCASVPCNNWNISKTAGTNIISGPNLGGNYWSGYTGNDTDADGLGDTGLPYNSGGNINTGGDYHPYTCSDIDGDGYNSTPGYFCGPIDCDDTNPAINPGATEVCDNAIDDDCDSLTDCDDPDCATDPACAPPAPPGPSGRQTGGVTIPTAPPEKVPVPYTLLKPGMSFNEETNTLTVVIPESQVLTDLKIKLKSGAVLPPDVSVDTQVKSLDTCVNLPVVAGKTLLSCTDISSNIPDSDIESATLNYKVPNVLLIDRRINLDAIAASRDSELVQVSEISSDNSFTYFEVVSPGLSRFVMFGDLVPVPVIDLRPVQIALVVLAICAVLWILLLGWYFKRKPERPKEKLPPHIQRLHGYIKHTKKLGATHEEIKQKLIEAGWRERHIVEELKKFF